MSSRCKATMNLQLSFWNDITIDDLLMDIGNHRFGCGDTGR